MNLTGPRRLTQLCFILLIFLIPVFDLLRYDSDARQLIVLGRSWSLGLPDHFYDDRSATAALAIAARFLMNAILPWLLFLGLFPLLGFFFGRFFCGWLCPEGALFEMSDYFTLKILGKRNLWGKATERPASRRQRLGFLILAIIAGTTIPLAGGIALTGYLVAPQTIWLQVATGTFTPGVRTGIIGVAVYMVITSLLVRHALCRFVCAAGLMQMLFGWISPISLRLNMETARISQCTDCKGCDRACFMSVSPRKQKRDISCVACGACVDACNRELGQKKGLFSLAFGNKFTSPAHEPRVYPPIKEK